MLRLLSILVIGVLPVLALAQGPSPTLERIAETGKFRIGYVPDAAPLSFEDAYGNPVGYSIDLCRYIAASIRDSRRAAFHSRCHSSGAADSAGNSRRKRR